MWLVLSICGCAHQPRSSHVFLCGRVDHLVAKPSLTSFGSFPGRREISILNNTFNFLYSDIIVNILLMIPSYSHAASYLRRLGTELSDNSEL